MTSEVKCWCQNCGRELPPSHTGECPYCHKTGKRCEATASVVIGLKVSAETEVAYFRWFRKTLSETLGSILLDIAITIVSAVIGVWIGGAIGVIVGVLINSSAIVLLNMFIRNKVKVTIREIRKLE